MSAEPDDTSWDTDYLLRHLRAMDDYDFEHLVGDLWEVQGWETEVEQQSADAGVDVRATKSSPYYRKILIQAKRYSDDNPVTGPNVQQYSALKQQENNVDESIIVTTGRFTGSAEDMGEKLNVKLIDGQGLVAMFDDLNAYDIVGRYIEPPRSTEPQVAIDQGRSSHSPSSNLSAEDLTKIKKHMRLDIDTYLKNEKYRTDRAKERARKGIELNPHDAKELGIFDGLPLYDFEREFVDRKPHLTLLKDDVHLEEGDIYVEDVTDYIDSAAIKGNPSGPVIGVIRRGVKDKAWMSETGRAILNEKKRKQQSNQESQDIISSFETSAAESDDLSRSESHDSATASQEPEPSQIETETYNELQSEHNADAQEATTQAAATDLSSQSPLDTQSDRSESSPSDSNYETRSTTEEDTQSTELAPLDLTRTKWFYGTAAGTAGWALVWVLFALLPNATAIGGLLTLASWVLLPVAMLMDTRRTGVFSASKWRSLGYVIISAIPLFAVIPGTVYLYRRESSWNDQ